MAALLLRQSRQTDTSILTRNSSALNGGHIRIRYLLDGGFRVQPILKRRVNERGKQRMRSERF